MGRSSAGLASAAAVMPVMTRDEFEATDARDGLRTLGGAAVKRACRDAGIDPARADIAQMGAGEPELCNAIRRMTPVAANEILARLYTLVEVQQIEIDALKDTVNGLAARERF